MLSKGGSGEITLYVYNSDHKDIQWLNGKGKDISKTLKFSVKSHKKGKVNKYDCYKTAVTFKVTGLKEGCLNVKAKKKVISSNKCRYSIYSKMKEDGFTVNGNHSPLQGASNSSSAKKKDGKEILVKEATGAKIIGKCGKYYYVKVKGVNGFLKKSDVAYLKLKKSKKSMYRYHKGHLDAKILNNPSGKYKVEWKIIKNQGKITDIQYTTNKGYNRIKFFADKPTDKFRIRVQCKYADGKYIHKDISIKIKDIKIVFHGKRAIEVGENAKITAEVQTLPDVKVKYRIVRKNKHKSESGGNKTIRKSSQKGIKLTGYTLEDTYTIYAKYKDLKATYKINVDSMLIYQTIDDIIAGNDTETGKWMSVPNDYRYGDLTEKEILAKKIGISKKYISLNEASHSLKYEMACDFFADGKLERVSLEMKNRFMHGDEGTYMDSDLTEKVINHRSTRKNIKISQEAFRETLKDNHKGNVRKFKYKYTKDDSVRSNNAFIGILSDNNYRLPVFNYPFDYTNGLVITIHGFWCEKIELISYGKDDDKYYVTLRHTLYDHYGLDGSDVNGEFERTIDGLKSWYILQHNDIYKGTHRPFLTCVVYDDTFEVDYIKGV